jgi:hypothetical protein
MPDSWLPPSRGRLDAALPLPSQADLWETGCDWPVNIRCAVAAGCGASHPPSSPAGPVPDLTVGR